MTPYHEAAGATFYLGDVRGVLRELPAESVHCVVTSPPYWSLRDYGIPPSVWGGGPDCKHEWGDTVTQQRGGIYNGKKKWQHIAEDAQDAGLPVRDYIPEAWGHPDVPSGQFCELCGAWRGALGLEPTVDLYVEHIVEVFREVKRVLRKDGVCWLNLGDSYAIGNGASFSPTDKQASNRGSVSARKYRTALGFKPKDLVGMPWRVAFALQADGWWLRSEVTWCKQNPMPESAKDRPTSATEKIFLLSKSERYFYDNVAVREPVTGNAHARGNGVNPKAAEDAFGSRQNSSFSAAVNELVSGRNMRNFWLLPTQPFPESHFAVFPEAIPEKCIMAGTSARGACADCGAPWRRVTEEVGKRSVKHGAGRGHKYERANGRVGETSAFITGEVPVEKTIDWEPSCKHDGSEVVPCVVLEPFLGSGTTAKVALALGRHVIGIDLKAEYLDMAIRRSGQMGMALA